MAAVGTRGGDVSSYGSAHPGHAPAAALPCKPQVAPVGAGWACPVVDGRRDDQGLHPQPATHGGRCVSDHPAVPHGREQFTGHTRCDCRTAVHLGKRARSDSGVARASHVHPTPGCSAVVFLVFLRPSRSCYPLAVAAESTRSACAAAWPLLGGPGRDYRAMRRTSPSLELLFAACPVPGSAVAQPGWERPLFVLVVA